MEIVVNKLSGAARAPAGMKNARRTLTTTEFEPGAVRDGQPILGTGQQVVLVDYDTRARRRELHVTVIGE